MDELYAGNFYGIGVALLSGASWTLSRLLSYIYEDIFAANLDRIA